MGNKGFIVRAQISEASQYDPECNALPPDLNTVSDRDAPRNSVSWMHHALQLLRIAGKPSPLGGEPRGSRPVKTRLAGSIPETQESGRGV